MQLASLRPKPSFVVDDTVPRDVKNVSQPRCLCALSISDMFTYVLENRSWSPGPTHRENYIYRDDVIVLATCM